MSTIANQGVTKGTVYPAVKDGKNCALKLKNPDLTNLLQQCRDFLMPCANHPPCSSGWGFF